MSQKRRRHTPEFRRRAVELLISGRSLQELAGELEVGATTLWRWKEMYLHDAAAGARPKEDDRPADRVYQENQELRRRLKELETHHEILKKALGILSTPTLPPGMP